MIKQNIVTPELFEQVLGFRGQAKFARNIRLVLQVWSVGLLVNVEKSWQIHRPIYTKHLPRLQAKICSQALGNFRVRISVDLQADRVTFTPIVKFGAH